MFKKTNPINMELQVAYEKLSQYSPETHEYRIILDNIKELERVKKEDKKLDPVIVGAIVNIVGILIVLGYEHAHPITSKAFGMVHRMKI